MTSIGILTRIELRRLIFLGFIIVSLASHSEEGGDKKAVVDGDDAPKASPTQIYEKEESTKGSFTAHVTTIRESETVEVFFDGKNKGPYILKDDPNLGVFKEKLVKSQKKKDQTVNVKTTDDVITGVELVEVKAAEKKKSDLDSVLSDILKK